MNTRTAERVDVIDADMPQALPLASQPIRDIQAAQSTPDNLLAMAMQNGASIEMMERLLALKERHDATEARKAYTEDMALAKKNPPTIGKDKHVRFETQKGVTSYNHATLGNVVAKIVAWLAEYRFSHAWRTEQLEGGRIAVTCTLTHAMGHSESVTLDSSKEDSGTKNNIQAMGSAITYLQRYTILAITGLATEEQDDDGASAGVDAVTAVAGENIAAKMLGDFRVQLKACTTDQSAATLWAAAGKALLATGDKKAYVGFRDEVVAHRTALRDGGSSNV